MSLTRDMIEVKKTQVASQIMFEVRVLLTNKNVISSKMFIGVNKHVRLEMEEQIVENLQRSIVAYVYSDMVDDINKLALLAKRLDIHMQHAEELDEIQENLASIAHGHGPIKKDDDEEKEPSLIITPD